MLYIVACDGSEQSKIMLRTAASTLLTKADTVVLATVLPRHFGENYSLVSPPVGQLPGSKHRHNLEEQHAKEVLDEAKAVIKEVKVPLAGVQEAVLDSKGPGAAGTGEALVDLAVHKAADALVMGSRGQSAFRKSLLGLLGTGSVATWCLHHAKLPLIIVPPRGARKAALTEAQPTADLAAATEGLSLSDGARRVVVAMDNSDSALHALSWVLEGFMQPEDKLYIVCIGEKKDTTSAAGDECDDLRAMQMIQQKKQIDMAHVHTDKVACERGIIHSHLVEALCKYVEDKKAHLLVMGNRGRGSGIKRVLPHMGSVAEGAVRTCTCPVAVINEQHQLPAQKEE